MLGVPGTPLRSFNWNEIAALVAASEELEIQWDEDYQAAYLYDAAGNTYYSFDNPRAIETKIPHLVNELDLRGVMAWEFDGDGDADPTARLPETGSNSAPALIAAGILLIVGAAAVLLTHSRRCGA